MLRWGRFFVMLDDVDLEPRTLDAIRAAIVRCPTRPARQLDELLALVNGVLAEYEPGLRTALLMRPDGAVLVGAERSDWADRSA